MLHDKTKLVEVFKNGLKQLSDRERNIILLRFDVVDENEVIKEEGNSTEETYEQQRR